MHPRPTARHAASLRFRVHGGRTCGGPITPRQVLSGGRPGMWLGVDQRATHAGTASRPTLMTPREDALAVDGTALLYVRLTINQVRVSILITSRSLGDHFASEPA